MTTFEIISFYYFFLTCICFFAALVTSFNLEIGITGAILTKLDGDSRGGAALSVREVWLLHLRRIHHMFSSKAFFSSQKRIIQAYALHTPLQ